MPSESKSLGAAIDEIIAALVALDAPARITAIRAACDHLDLTVPGDIEGSRDFAESMGAEKVTGSLVVHETPLQPTNIRSLKEQKRPASAIEMVCVVAYFLQYQAPTQERKNDINAADVKKYFVQGDFPLPRRSDQLLVDAKAAGYFDSAARGVYRLNAVGYNLVAHTLPRNRQQTGATSSRLRKRSATKSKQQRRKPKK